MVGAVEILHRGIRFILQGPVVRKRVSANPVLNFNPGFFFFL